MSTDTTDAGVETDDTVYPDSDGRPMSDNTLQWDWMVKIVGELRELFAGQEVFVAGDLLWYPVYKQGDIRSAPDAMVAFGRPPGYRGSYRQWLEGGVAPQVVFEVISPGNTEAELDAKDEFYDRYGVEEYYLIDPYGHGVHGQVRRGGSLMPVADMRGFVSPRLGVRFERGEGGELRLYAPDGREFKAREDRVEEIKGELRRAEEELVLAVEEAERERSLAEAESRRADAEMRRGNAASLRAEAASLRADAELRRAEAERRNAEAESRRAEVERQRADAEGLRAKAERAAREVLAAKLRELGVDPDGLLGP